MIKFLHGDCIEMMKTLPDNSVNCCVTSPPYFGLRDYGVEGQIGLEPTPDEFVQKLVEVFREVKRVLRDDGTLWLNLGDSYWGGKGMNGSSKARATAEDRGYKQSGGTVQMAKRPQDGTHETIKPKDLIGIPWRVAFALQADGWYLRQDIIWCLSGGTCLYARTQKGDMPITIKDLARLDPKTVKLWNGEKWTQLLGMNKSERMNDEIEIVLRSGERISCTPTHKFPTDKGLLEARDIKIGDLLQSCKLPEPENTKDCSIDNDAAWFAGLYIAEGSMSEDTIQIAGNAKEIERWKNVSRIAKKFGGSARKTIDGNSMNIRVYGKILVAIIKELVSGDNAHNKGFANVTWRYSNSFLSSLIDGYLSGDGHKDGDRWRLGFCRNYNLERDLRVACSRLGYSLTLNMSSVAYNGGRNPTFRGELRKTKSDHHNNKNKNEVVEIRKSRCRYVWDLGVEDEPHLFSLASGVLTHNSKPNPMPESVKDRCTKAHEYIFLLSKKQKYYFDSEPIKEDAKHPKMMYKSQTVTAEQNAAFLGNAPSNLGRCGTNEDGKRNKRSVWTVTTKPFKGAHFATFPPDLILPCILAGCPENGVVLDPFNGAGTTGLVSVQNNRNYIGIELNAEYLEMARARIEAAKPERTLFDD